MSKKAPQPAALDICARHERKQAILGEIAAVREAIGNIHETIGALERQSREAASEQSSLERDLKAAISSNRTGNVAGLEERIGQFKGYLAELDEQRQVAERESHRLAGELDRLEKAAMPGREPAATLEDVIAHQMSIADLEQEAAKLADAILKKRRFVQEISDQLPVIAERAEERCELLALAAINQGTQAQIDELDAKVAAEQLEYDRVLSQSREAIDQAEQAIAGLGKLRAGVTDKIYALQSLSPYVMEQFLRGEMDTLGDAYVQKAREIKDLFIRLHGVNMLLYGVMGQDPGLLGSHELSIPGFNMKACRDVPTRGQPALGEMFREEIAGQRATAWQKAMACQRARLRELGINLI